MRRFADALTRPGPTAIAEVKRRSPSAGDLRPDADPATIAAAYERAGAAAVSILVDERFAGDWDDLRAARRAASLPLLAKGFFRSEDDLRTAREAGADAALLLLRDLADDEVTRLMAIASDLGLETLVEAHDSRELERAVARINALEGHLAQRDASIVELEGMVRAVNVARDQAEAEHRQALAHLDEELRGRDATIDAKQREIDRRGGLRWWLRLPLHRFGLLRSKD